MMIIVMAIQYDIELYIVGVEVGRMLRGWGGLVRGSRHLQYASIVCNPLKNINWHILSRRETPYVYNTYIYIYISVIMIVDLKLVFLESIILYTNLYPKVSPAFQIFKKRKHQNNRHEKRVFFKNYLP